MRGTEPAGHVRIGYARASTVRQSVDTQLDSLRAAGVTRIFSEKISTRATRRPELDKAISLAEELRASGVAVTLVVHEHKRLGRVAGVASIRCCCAVDQRVTLVAEQNDRLVAAALGEA